MARVVDGVADENEHYFFPLAKRLVEHHENVDNEDRVASNPDELASYSPVARHR